MRYFDNINAWAIDFPEAAAELLQKRAFIVPGQVAVLAKKKSGEIYKINANVCLSVVPDLFYMLELPAQDQPYIVLAIDSKRTYRDKNVVVPEGYRSDEIDMNSVIDFMSLLEWTPYGGSYYGWDLNKANFEISDELYRKPHQYSYISIN